MNGSTEATTRTAADAALADGLGLYRWMSQARWLDYRAKIMVMAFVGTHIPLLAIILFVAFTTFDDLSDALAISAVALVATLIGTGLTLWVLNQLLRPVVLTSKVLRRYRETRAVEGLPTGFADEAGTLMSDAHATLRDLDGALHEITWFDGATGLPNRARFTQALAERCASGVAFGTVAVRLADHARLAATFGDRGATVMAAAQADRLRGLLVAGHGLARIAPDTFAFVLPVTANAWDLGPRVENLLADLRRDVTLDTVTARPEVLAGIALHPEDGHEAEVLLDHALPGRAPGDPAVAFFSAPSRDAAREQFVQEQGRARDTES
jgi:GGDEF domain-containing protein